MKPRVLLIVAAFFVVATIAPTTLRAAGDAFWYGVNIEDAGMDPMDMEKIHDAIKTAIENLAAVVGGPTGFPTGDPVNDDHRGVRIYDRDKTWEGYTLLNCIWPTSFPGGGNQVLIDMDGNIVNEWFYPFMPYISATKVLPGGYIVGGLGAPPGGTLTQMDWEGNIVKQWDGTVMHHDHEREGSPCGYYAPYKEPKTFGGKVLVLEAGFPPEAKTGHICSSKPIMDDTIRELSWDGEELFKWECWLHFDEFGLDDWAEAGIDLGLNYQGPPPGTDLPEDWSHGNAVAWVGKNKWWDKYRDVRFHPDNIIADFRSLNITIIIARHDFPEANIEQGDIVWKLGPNYSTAGDDYKVGEIIGQHQAHMIPKGLPGEGNMLIFDNGGAAGYGALVQGLTNSLDEPLGYWPSTFRLFSRVLEINPVTKQIVWEYKQPYLSEDGARGGEEDGIICGNEKLFFSNLMSGMQRLPNGNTLICEADVGRIFEVTESGEVVWEYAPTWLKFAPPVPFLRAVYRAYRVPYWWVPKDDDDDDDDD